MAKYSNSLNLRKRKSRLKSHKKLLLRNSRRYSSERKLNKHGIRSRIRRIQKHKFIQQLTAPLLSIPPLLVIIVLTGMNYVDTVQKELPSPDNPFQNRNQSSIVYSTNSYSDSKAEELYRLYGNENRDLIQISEIPEHVKWAVLAAEDVDFYTHKGFDLGGIIKAILYNFFGMGEERGGSTITQQLIKQTTLSAEKSLDRKLKELILSIRVEDKYSKDQILEMYLNTNNYGGNIYGIKTASEFYFGKQVKDLTLAEASILARIPQSPAYNSPTLSIDNKGLERADQAKTLVLSLIEKNLDKINGFIESDDNIIISEDIEKARKEVVTYKDSKIFLQAGHFVFYVQNLLTKLPYNGNKPFTLEELQTDGYKIYTSLDTNIQKIMEEEVKSGVDKYAAYRNGHNGAAVLTDPKNGNIISLVGSKDFFGKNEGKFFDSKVNVPTSLQSMGSSMKPVAYYKAFNLGIASPGSYLPDIPIKLGGYTPRNWDGGFMGFSNGATPRNQLSRSRNIPAVMLVDSMGVSNYVDTLENFGYFTIAADKDNYGASLVLGGGDITMIEHAQGYGVFANGGNFVNLDPVIKITKYNSITREEETIYEKKVNPHIVADSKSIYMVNHILNYKNGGPGGYVDGRDFAGKTGTSELHKDTIYAGYTPEFVIIGWNGNNDNTPMIYGSWGENVTKPWVISASKRIAQYFPEKSYFTRPGGLGNFNGDLAIEGSRPNNSIYLKYSPLVLNRPTPTPE